MEKRQKPSLHFNWIDPEATLIIERLQKANFTTYLVGGCVRDLLAGIYPKDFDIATSASPEQVRKHVRGSYIIGKRFPLVLVKRGSRQFEIATFRRSALPEELEGNDQSFIDNFYGSPMEDAQRRDFTVNGLFYDPIHDELIDYVGGRKDIENGFIKMIGNPEQRLKEDPIRILRAIRLSHKLRFSIEESLRLAIETHSQELTRSILPRKREEYFKLMRLDDPSLVFEELHDLKILEHILPTLASLWSQEDNAKVLMHYLARTHELSIDTSNTTQLMLPLLLALNKILSFPRKPRPAHSLPQPSTPGENSENEGSSSYQLTETLFKAEWGLFKTEQQSLYEALEILNQIQPIENLLRKGNRRLKNLFSRENTHLALLMAKTDYLFSGEQWLKIEALQKQLDP